MNKEELMAKVDASLDHIRPYLEADGGGIHLLDISDDYTAMVELQGACNQCSMSHMTMKAGVEQAIKTAVPEIKAVMAV